MTRRSSDLSCQDDTPSLVLLRNLLLSRPHANRASSEALHEENPNKQALPTALCQKKGKVHKQRAPRAHRGQHCRPRKPKAPNHAVGQRKGEGKLQISSKRAPGGKTKRARYTYHHGKVVLFFAVQLTLIFMISRLARSPQENYSHFWASGSTSAPPLSAPRLT